MCVCVCVCVCACVRAYMYVHTCMYGYLCHLSVVRGWHFSVLLVDVIY